jgi:hypothetical protein
MNRESLFTNGDTFFILENMSPLFFLERMGEQVPLLWAAKGKDDVE